MKTKKKVWSELRAIANSEPGTVEAETEKGMAIAALSAVYRYLLRRRRRVGGKRHKNKSVDSVDS